MGEDEKGQSSVLILGMSLRMEEHLGDGVNIAAAWKVFLKQEAFVSPELRYDQVENKLSLGYEYLGEQTVKNIAKPVRVYRILMEPEAAGKVIGEKRAKPIPWQRVTIVLMAVIGIVVTAAVVIWKFYAPPASSTRGSSLRRKSYSRPAGEAFRDGYSPYRSLSRTKTERKDSASIARKSC